MSTLKQNLKKHMLAQRIVAGVFLLLVIASLIGFNRSPVAAALAVGQRIPILIFGLDAADASHHTDTLMLGVWDPLFSRMNVINIPRDTRVRIPGYRFRRINEIYGYHVRKTKDPIVSSQKVIEGVEHVVSSEKTKLDIPYFVQVDFGGFRKLVDLIGGVWVTVKTPMHYDDNAGNYHFHKEPGRYLMEGEEALNYVRYRGPTGDRGRIYRTQGFLRSMAKRTANPLNVLRYPQMVSAIASSVQTNLRFWDLIYLVHSVRTLRSSGMKFYILPGKPRGAYWRVKKQAAHALASSIILGHSMVEEQIMPIVPQAERITVKVWNASGRQGWARKTTRYLREKGFDVVDWGNYAVQQVPTRVIDRTGNIIQAQAVAESLGIESFHSEPNIKALVDVEVIIGKNYNGIGTME